VQLQIQWFKLADWPRQITPVDLGQPSPAVIPAEQWTNVAATGSRPAEADLALVVIIVGNGQTTGGTVWADDCKFRQGAYPEPIISNPGFESDTNVDGQPDAWGPFNYGPGFVMKQDTTVSHSGSASASATGAKDHGDRSGYYQATPLFTPPAKVRLSYWYKGTGRSALTMHLLTPAGVQKPGGGIEYAVMTATPELSPQWQQFSKEIDVPREARDAGIMRLDVILYQRGEGTVWYDDVKVELVE
ncbi:MAG: carbohydrate binding domain-containing protein, partial [Bacteroidota bacterium]